MERARRRRCQPLQVAVSVIFLGSTLAAFSSFSYLLPTRGAMEVTSIRDSRFRSADNQRFLCTVRVSRGREDHCAIALRILLFAVSAGATALIVQKSEIGDHMGMRLAKHVACRHQVELLNSTKCVRVDHRNIVEVVLEVFWKVETLVLTVIPDVSFNIEGVALQEVGLHFCAAPQWSSGPDKVRDALGWVPAHSMEGDLSAFFEEYMRCS